MKPIPSEIDRATIALLELAQQGERDIIAGRRSSLAEHRARMRALLHERSVVRRR
jgi:hypothetical protein